MRRAVASALAALALVCAAPANANRTAAVDAAGAVHAFVVGTDGALYHAPPGGVLARAGGTGLVQEPVAAVRDASGEIVVAARGEDGTVYVLPGGEWSARVPVAPGAAGSPELLLDGADHLRLFFRGIDGKLWTAAHTATGWGTAEALDGDTAGEPAAILDRTSNPVVWARDVNGGLRVWRDDAGWGTMSSGALITSDIAVARHADGRLHVLARGDDGKPWSVRQDPAGTLSFGVWAKQADLEIAGTPSLAVAGSGLLHAFARGVDGALWWAYQEPANGAWSQWTSLGGTLTGDPVAIRNRFGLIEVFAPSTGATWITRTQTGPVEWDLAFRPLGESTPPTDPPPAAVQPTPTPTPTVVPPTYAPKRLVVDLRANAKASRTSTLFKDLSLRSVPAGATVSATCEKGCKRPSLTFKNVAGTVSLKAFFAKRAQQGTLKAGTKIRVVVSAPNMIAAVKTLTVRARRAPTVATRCLAPGAATETLCVG